MRFLVGSVIDHAVTMEVDLASIRCRDEAVVFFGRNLRNSPMSFDLVELDLAARALCQSLDLSSGGRERVLDRDLNVHVAPVIGRLVADHDVLVGRNRYPDVDTIDGTVAVLRIRRDDGNTTPGNAVLVFLQPLHLMSIAARTAS